MTFPYSEKNLHKVADYVNIQEEYLSPLKGVRWHTIHKGFKMHELRELRSLRIRMPSGIKPGSEIKAAMIFPKMRKGRPVKGYRTHRAFKEFEYSNDTDEPKVSLELFQAYKYLKRIGVPKNKPVHFKIQFVPERVIES